MTRTTTAKALSFMAILALLLACALMIVAPQKAHAATTIKEVGVTVDFDAIPMNAATTGNEANEAFKANRGLDSATQNVCKLDYNYSFVAEKVSYGSNGQILRKRLAGSDDLMTATDSSEGYPKTRQYCLVFNLIQKEGYEFPEGEANLQNKGITVKVNGVVRTDIQIDRYNTDSVDVYVPIDFDSRLIVEKIVIDPGMISMKQGTTRQLKAVITGSQEAQLVWYVNGAKSSGTTINSSTGELKVSSSEPNGNRLTVVAAFKDDQTIKGLCTVDVIDKNPTITGVNVTPGNTAVDVSDGNAKSVDFKVNITGTADHDWTYEVHNAKNSGTEITNVTADGFRLTVSGREPTGAIRIIVTSVQDPSQSNFITVDVKGVHRVDKIALNYNADVLYVDGTRTPNDLASYINFDNASSSGLYTYIDFTRNDKGETFYTYIARREKTRTGWNLDKSDPDLQSMKSTNPITKDDLDKPFNTSKYDYFIVFNVENREKGQNISLWPENLKSIAVTANGVAIGKEDRADDYGQVVWYSESDTGSIRVIVPLAVGKPAESALKFKADPYAPGVYAITATTNLPAPTRSGVLGYTNVLKYKNSKTMYYDFGRDKWYLLIQGSEPKLAFSDFSIVTIAQYQTTEFYAFPEHQLFYEYANDPDVRGDVNRTGKLNVVDAQIVYDVACGKSVKDSLPMKGLIMCDVNNDEYVDANDAYAIQVAAILGGFPKG